MYSRCHCTMAAHTHVIMIYSLDTPKELHTRFEYLFIRTTDVSHHSGIIVWLSRSLSLAFASFTSFLLWKNNEHELLVFNIKFNNIVCRSLLDFVAQLDGWLFGWIADRWLSNTLYTAFHHRVALIAIMSTIFYPNKEKNALNKQNRMHLKCCGNGSELKLSIPQKCAIRLVPCAIVR